MQIAKIAYLVAVMFTFSFSTAFAMPKADYNEALAKAYFDSTMKAIKESTTAGIVLEGYTVDYEILAANYDAIFEAVTDFVTSNADSHYVGNSTDMANEIQRMVNILVNVEDNAELKMSLVAAQYAEDKAEAIAILEGLDTSAYSTKEMPKADTDGCKTYKEHVEYLISKAIKAINAHTFTSDSGVSKYVDAKNTIVKQFTTAYGTTATDAIAAEKGYEGVDGYVGLGIYEVNTKYAIAEGKTVADYKTTAVDALDATAEAKIAAKKAEIAAEYAAFIAKNSTKGTYAANVKKILDTVAETGYDVKAGYWFNTSNLSETNAANAVAAVADFEARAAKLAAEVDANGTLVRNAEAVEKLVEEGTYGHYYRVLWPNAATYAYRSMDICENAIKELYTGLADAELAFEKAVRETAVADFLAEIKADETYYPAELAKVEALTTEYLAKVNAVTSLTKVDTYDNDYETKVEAVMEAKDLATDYATPIGKLQSVAEAYAEFYNEQAAKDANEYIDDYDYAKLDALIVDLVGNAGARTTKDITALSDEAIALVQTLPTNAAVEAADEAVKAAIKALPTKVTVADKAAIDAAIEAADAYEALTTKAHDQVATINTAVMKYAYAYNNAIATKVAAVDKTDKAAVEAILDEIDEFVTTYGEDTADAFENSAKALEDYLGAIQKAAAKAVEKAIAAIPAISNLTAKDAATVEAARAAYDAYVAEYTNYRDTVDGFVADDFAYDELLAAETALGLNDNTEEKIIASVESLKLKASSTKGKGWIKVQWKVTGDTTNVEGYQLYKSTKAQTGYKKCITTTKTSFKNTKNIKAGTRYYYKVRAFVTVDGVKYYSDWSNKANRVAK